MSSCYKPFLASMLIAVCVSSTVRAGLEDHALAVWLFDEGSGDVAADALDTFNGSLLGEVGWVSEGKFGSAVSFPGVKGQGDRIEVPHDPRLSLENWTITAWAKLKQPEHGDWTVLLVKDPTNGTQNYALDFTGSGSVVAEMTNEGQWSDTQSSTKVYDDEWHFLAGSYDGDLLRVYVDGIMEKEQDIGPGDVNDAPVTIGDRPDASQPLFGVVDDVGLFKAALSDEELQEIMDMGLKQALGLGVGMAGDFNSDGTLDATDIDDLTSQSATSTSPPAYDLNADNLVNETDVNVWIKDLFNSWIGDADLNGEFSSSDLVNVLAAGTYEADVDAVWSTGDFNGDGRTNSTDLVAALADGGYELGPRAAVAAAVPEPTAIVLVLLGAILSGHVGRRRS